VDNSTRYRNVVDEMAVLVHFVGRGDTPGIQVRFLGLINTPEVDATSLYKALMGFLEWKMPGNWKSKMVTFAVDSAAVLGAHGSTAKTGVTKATESNVFSMLKSDLPNLVPLAEPCHLFQRRLGAATKGSATHAKLSDSIATVRVSPVSIPSSYQIQPLSYRVPDAGTDPEP
jgi:hypothetical protein